MKIARVVGTLTATIKDKRLSGKSFLIVNIEDGDQNVLEKSVVCLDTCGAGVGDRVLVTMGSSARIPESAGVIPVDAAIVAVIDEINKTKK